MFFFLGTCSIFWFLFINLFQMNSSEWEFVGEERETSAAPSRDLCRLRQVVSLTWHEQVVIIAVNMLHAFWAEFSPFLLPSCVVRIIKRQGWCWNVAPRHAGQPPLPLVLATEADSLVLHPKDTGREHPCISRFHHREHGTAMYAEAAGDAPQEESVRRQQHFKGSAARRRTPHPWWIQTRRQGPALHHQPSTKHCNNIYLNSVMEEGCSIYRLHAVILNSSTNWLKKMSLTLLTVVALTGLCYATSSRDVCITLVKYKNHKKGKEEFLRRKYVTVKRLSRTLPHNT